MIIGFQEGRVKTQVLSTFHASAFESIGNFSTSTKQNAEFLSQSILKE